MRYEPLIAQLKRHEGERLDLHKCPAGYWSIGYGHNLQAKGISKDIANLILLEDLADAEEQVRKHIHVKRLSDARLGVLINMAFNLGMHGLLGFKQFLYFLSMDDYERAADEMLDSRWAT
mgnify:FL=1|tara:strand:+ start:787 stop:1146 length:360 start_codon:yes stop_codon:yes gene_type:complete